MPAGFHNVHDWLVHAASGATAADLARRKAGHPVGGLTLLQAKAAEATARGRGGGGPSASRQILSGMVCEWAAKTLLLSFDLLEEDGINARHRLLVHASSAGSYPVHCTGLRTLDSAWVPICCCRCLFSRQ